MKNDKLKAEKKLVILALFILVCLNTGCSKTGIGGNPELLKEQETDESEYDDESEIEYYTFDVKSERIKKDLLSLGMNLAEEKIEDEMEYCYRLVEKSGLFTIELFDEVSDGESMGCHDIDIYYSEKMIKEHDKENSTVLRKIFKDIGAKYKASVKNKVKDMFEEKQTEGSIEQKYNNNIQLIYSWEEDRIKLRIQATDYQNEQEDTFSFNRSDVAKQIKAEQLDMSEAVSEGDESFVNRMLTFQGKDISVVVRDNKKEIDKKTGTEALYVEFKIEKLNEEEGVLEIGRILKAVLKLTDSDFSDKRIEDYISQLKEVVKTDDGSKEIKLKNASMCWVCYSGKVEISILPE